MPSLSSCYFCGTALDAPIDTYPVVPEGLPIEADHTVSLCPTCQRKLHGVLEITFDAVTDADSIETALDEYEDLAAEETPAPASEGPSSETADSSAESTPDETAGPSESDDAGDDPVVEREPSTEIESHAEAGVEAGQADADSTDEPDDGATDADDDLDADATEVAGTGLEADEQSEPADDDDTTAGSDVSTTEAETETETDAGESATDDDPDADDEPEGRPAILSTPAAKKVIRLLQNRDFPVQRDEFEDVASNAYAIPRQDCVDVLDALVSEGYVAESRGQLVRDE